jgi:hypothetical protein
MMRTSDRRLPRRVFLAAFSCAALTPVIIFCCMMMASCAKVDENETSFGDLIRTGKEYLVVNRGKYAVQDFRAAQKMKPDSPDANFGLMLANTMQFINTVDAISGLVGSFFYSAPDESAEGDGGVVVQAETQSLGYYLHNFFNAAAEQSFDENEVIFEKMAGQPDFSFQLDSYPIVYGLETLAAFEGEFDKTDLYAVGSVTALMNAVIDIVQSLNLDFDIFALSIPTVDFANDLPGSLQSILDLMDGLMNNADCPNFLMIEGQDGIDRMEEAGIMFGDAFARVVMALDQLAAETDDQTDDQIRYDDINMDGHYDFRTEPVMVGEMETLDPELVLIIKQLSVDMKCAFWEGSSADVHPARVDTLNLGMFNDLLVYLDILSMPILPDWLGVNIGKFFSDPSEDGLRSLMLSVMDLLESLMDIIDSQAASPQSTATAGVAAGLNEGNASFD